MTKRTEGSLEVQAKESRFSNMWQSAQTRLGELHRDFSSYLGHISRMIVAPRTETRSVEELLENAEKMKGEQLEKLLLLAMERLGELHTAEIQKLDTLFQRESKIVNKYTYEDTILYPETYHTTVGMYVVKSIIAKEEGIADVQRKLAEKAMNAPKRAIDSYVKDACDDDDDSIPVFDRLTVSDMDKSIAEEKSKNSKSGEGFFSDAKNQKWTLKNLYLALERRKQELEKLRIREIQRQILERMIKAQEGDPVLSGLTEAQNEFKRMCAEHGIGEAGSLQDFPPSIPFETSFHTLDPKERAKTFLLPHIKEQYLKQKGTEYESQ